MSKHPFIFGLVLGVGIVLANRFNLLSGVR